MTNIVIVGEAWGKEEEEQRAPFVGPTGKLLNALLHEAGIARGDCFVTNVFNLRPRPTNDISNLCGPKTSAIPGTRALKQGKYIRAEYEPEINRLYKEIKNEAPNLILALGNTPLWALTGQGSISKNRGTVIESHLGYKVLPTYHPAALFRNWSLRPIVSADLQKAKREAAFPEIRRPHRSIYIYPTLSDIEWFYNEYLVQAEILSIDIETKGSQITEFGVAPNWFRALVIPFYSRELPSGNYWPTHGEEVKAWEWVRRICAMSKPKVGQNFMYDMKFLWQTMGITCAGTEDTMLKHHALQPEMQKGLGFLGSVYTNEPAWKMMRKTDTVKKED